MRIWNSLKLTWKNVMYYCQNESLQNQLFIINPYHINLPLWTKGLDLITS